MKIFRPLWNEGVFLTPQQFQQQILWNQFSSQKLAAMSVANPWGIEKLIIDTQALTVDRLKVESISIRFPDGVFINTDVADKLPEIRALNTDIPVELEEVTVFVGIPLLLANGGNCLQDNQRLESPLRYRQEWIEVTDLFGQNSETIAVERYALTFLFDFEDHSDYLTCPIAKLKRDLNGQFVLDFDYIPPLMNLFTQSGALLKELELLCVQIQAKRQRLMGMRHERNQQMAEFAIADVSLFWLLNALNTFEPQLKFLRDNPTIHPENLYQTLTALTGALLTFSLANDVDGIPTYQHTTLNDVFPPLFELVRNLLEESLPSRVIKIDLVHDKDTLWTGRLNDSRLVEDADFYLSVRSSMPGHQLQSQFPILCKAGAPDDVRQIIHSALSGIPLKALSHVPAAIPMRLENQYFALDLSHNAAKNMLLTRCCEFYVPRAMPDISLELFAVLRS
ncbi:type VI secretion system baseplate subunit TssK [Gilliamella sp. A7]|uniref:type VI secretion system baseplate subunit TssK n=1 Tax=Gilliamella sp. A7 TaxID=1970465 RepID=UPI000A33C6A7|nr:type VI secretion system baseplate subunit TssK [Gilliamella sp. A7]MCT6866517.1 type VI secretion system baseplate subunit TssK [Gilliamella apicola]OTQ59394.1 type VI secretion system-associated protein [Gilliamella sp. A7]